MKSRNKPGNHRPTAAGGKLGAVLELEATGVAAGKAPHQRESRSPELARLIDALTAERYRPVPSRPGEQGRRQVIEMTGGADNTTSRLDADGDDRV